jgi:hypothetical protein
VIWWASDYYYKAVWQEESLQNKKLKSDQTELLFRVEIHQPLLNASTFLER